MPSLGRLLRAAGLAFGFWTVAAYGSPPQPAPSRADAARADAPAAFEPGPDLLSFYAERDFQPVWTDGADQALLDLLPSASGCRRSAQRHPSRRPPRPAARRHDAEPGLSRRGPRPAPARRGATRCATSMPASPRPCPRTSAALYALAAAPSPIAHARASLSRNPAYDGLTRGLAAYRARWSRLPQTQVAANKPDAAAPAAGPRRQCRSRARHCAPSSRSTASPSPAAPTAPPSPR